jgi:MscS family membrane protein
VNSRNLTLAAKCLNFDQIHASAQDELGPVLAFKLKYVLDRIGRIYIQEIPDNPEGPRVLLYRGQLGRIVLDRKAEEPGKGQWLFAPETVHRIEQMFRAALGQPVDESLGSNKAEMAQPDFRETPGIWLRLRLPPWLQARTGRLDLYQWLGLLLAASVSWAVACLLIIGISRLAAWLLHRAGSALSTSYVASTLRPLTWLGAVWFFFLLLVGLDLPVRIAGALFAIQKFLLAGLFGWLGLRFIDLFMSVYRNSELLRPHRSLGDMIVPVTMRLAKGTVLLIVATYMIYQVGEIELLGRFLTALGVAGLAASLAAQDAMKSFFGTLLLIGERAFKIGDWIIVGDKEGMVEQVGFRSTRLRTAEDSLLTVPNSVIASAPIDNMGARSLRRLNSVLVVSPDADLARLLEFRSCLQAWAADQPLVVREKIDVHVHRLTNNGIELSLTVYLAAKTLADENRFRESLNCQMLQLSETLGVTIATNQRMLLPQGSTPVCSTSGTQPTAHAA